MAASYPAQVQYPQFTTPSYQPLPEPKNHEIVVSSSNNNNYEKKNFHDVNFRVHWGPEISIDMEGGISREQEIARTSGLNNLISPDLFQEDSYSSSFFAAIKVNNAVYRFTYQFFFTFLAFAAGIFISFGMALAIATSEFLNQFVFRPLFRLTRIYAGFATFGSQVAYECLRPLFALFMPWNKQ
mmetsp:Transcript_5448/g.7653  ORF Transcript_5448/g.7653 Transcript_5448/m.7653 type:complete len:184 (+) Transcript_5448:37-588(+)